MAAKKKAAKPKEKVFEVNMTVSVRAVDRAAAIDKVLIDLADGYNSRVYTVLEDEAAGGDTNFSVEVYANEGF